MAIRGVFIGPLLVPAGLIVRSRQRTSRRCWGCAPRQARRVADDHTTIEQQDAAAEHLALVDRLERPCRRDLLGMHHHFHVARLQFFHAAIEYDAAAIDEHHIGEDVLDLFHLMRRHHDGAVAIEVVVEQGIVELLAKQNVEAKRRLVQHQQFRVNGHDQGQVQLRHHAL